MEKLHMINLTRPSAIHIAREFWRSQSQDIVDPLGINSVRNPAPKKSDLNNSAGFLALLASCHHITDEHNP